MRADNNWEDKVGKKLFEFEGELSPQGWDNIRKQIQPERKPWWRWLWLPALLLLLTIPAALYLSYEKPANPVAREEASQPPVTANSQKGPATVATADPENLPANRQLQEKPGQDATENQEPAKSKPEPTAGEKGKAGSASKQLADGKNRAPQVDVAAGIVAAAEPEKPQNADELNPERSASKTYRNSVSKTSQYAAGQIKNARKRPSKTQEKPGRSAPEISRNAAVTTELGPEFPETAKTNPGTRISIHRETEKNQAIRPELPASTTRTPEENSNAGTIPAATAPVKELAISKPDSAALASGNLAATVAQADSAAKSENAPVPEKNKRWSFGFYGSPQYSYQRIKANPTDEILILRMNNKNRLESERIGYEFGMRSYFALTQKVKIEGGLHFARLNQHLNFTTTRPGADSVMVIYQNGQLLIDVMNREQDEVQLFKYYFGGLYAGAQLSLNHSWHLSGGMGGNWMITKTPDEATIPIATKNFTPYLSAGLRYQFPIRTGMALQMGPTVQYYLRSIQKADAFCGTKPTNFGFSVGLLFIGKE